MKTSGLAASIFHIRIAQNQDAAVYFKYTHLLYYPLVGNKILDESLGERWRGRYNEDTDLSLRTLKSGLCTVLFNAFLGDKQTTMTGTGGNTESLYKLGDEIDGRVTSPVVS